MSSHDHQHTVVLGRNMVITMLLNFAITAAEVVGGVFSGSLSLISDALHNFSDGVAIIMSYVALRLAQRQPTQERTFGFKRAEPLAAVVNSAVLLIISLYLFKEAFERLVQPRQIDSTVMISVALVGLVANVLGTLLLREGAHDNLNIRSSYLHLFADALSSIAVVIGGILVYWFSFYWVDPLLTIGIGLYIVRESYGILAEGLRILMEASPRNFDVDALRNSVLEVPGVQDLHHVHVWQLRDGELFFEGHITVDAGVEMSSADQIRHEVLQLLSSEYAIHHATLQLESTE